MKVYTICAFVALAVSGTQAAMSPSDHFGFSARGLRLRSSPARAPRTASALKPAPAPAPKPAPASAPEPAPAPKPNPARAPTPAPKPAPAPAPALAPEPAPKPAAEPEPAPKSDPAPAPAPAPKSGRITSGQVGDLAIAAINFGNAIAPAVMGKQGAKDCHQTACWIETTDQACGKTAADQVQRELMNSRDTYEVESVNEQGMWVRYLRTEFNPPDRGDIASGSCSDGTPFTVTNCQSTGKVEC